MTKRAIPLWLLTAALGWAQEAVIQVDVDARDAPRRLIHAQLHIPVSPGPITLLYPQWIQGEHGPTGPIADVVSLRFRANNKTLAWRRDSGNLYAFHLTIPQDGTTLDAAFDFISPADAGGFTEGSSMTTELAVLNWNQYVLYPQGTPADQLRYQATLRLPHDWHYGTALGVAKESGNEIAFQPTSLATLIDSPVSAGAHYKTIDLGVFNGASHYIHIAADSERALAMPPQAVKQYKRLVAEASALFGSRHYRSYHFLLTLSDHVASFGLEHHESSDDRLGERTLHLPHGTIISTDDHLGKSIYPDVVVHQREIPNNLLTVEIRKASNHTSLEHDQHKLKALTDPHLWFAYWIGVYLVLGKHGVVSDVYVGGVLDQPLSAWLAGRLKDVELG